MRALSPQAKARGEYEKLESQEPLKVKQTKPWNSKQLAKTFEQQVFDRLIVNRRFHMTAIRLQLRLQLFFRSVEFELLKQPRAMLDSTSFKTCQRIFELARYLRCVHFESLPLIASNRLTGTC